MKIAFINNQYQLGGAETVINQLQRGLTHQNVENELFVAFGKSFPHHIKTLYPKALCRLAHTRLGNIVKKTFPPFKYTNAAFRKLANSSFDIIHLHNFHGNYASIDSLQYLAHKKPLVWTFHAFWGITGGCDHPKNCMRYLDLCGQCPQLGIWPLGNSDNTAEQLQEKLEKLSTAPISIIAPSKHLAEKVKNSPVGTNWRIHPIGNGVNFKEFKFNRKADPTFKRNLGLTGNKIVITIINRSFKDPLKGFPMAEKALSMTKKYSPHIEIALAGSDSDWAANRLSSNFMVTDFGYIKDAQKRSDLYEATDIFLFASEAENFPCVILEAMASKCCIVATPTSGVTEQIENGATGILASSIAGEALGEALLTTLARKEKISLLGENAYQHAKKYFSEEVMIDQHIHLYKNLLTP